MEDIVTWLLIMLCICAACIDLCALVLNIRKKNYPMAAVMSLLVIVMILCSIINIKRTGLL